MATAAIASTCPNHDVMIDNGYELKSDGKYYRAPKKNKHRKLDYFAATRACNAEQATLAMFKTAEEYEIVKEYWSK